MEITLETHTKLLRFVNVYRTPYSKRHRYTVAHFLDEFEQYLHVLKGKNGIPILLGDFNIHVEKLDDSNNKCFMDLLGEFNMCQLVPHTPTHVEGGTLDLIIMDNNQDLEISTPTTIKMGTSSDHFFVRAEFKNLKPSSTTKCPKIIEYRKFETINVENFRSELSNTEVVDISQFKNVDNAVNLLNTTLSKLMNKHCPIIKRKIKQKYLGPNWFDEELRNLRMKRRKAERLKRKNPNTDNKKCYVNICHEFDKLVRKKRKNFYQKSLQSSKNDPRSLYKKIRRLQGNDISVFPSSVNDSKLAEEFKIYFSSKIDKIRDTILEEKASKNIENYDLDKKSLSCQFGEFNALTAEDLSKIVNSMSDKFCSLDPIPTWLLKRCLPELSLILLYIVNKSLSVGYFPNILKHAVLNPTLKNEKLDSDLLKNYRPVSNLSFVSKFLEKCALSQLSEYLEQNKLISDAQSGYRRHHSCETLLIKMVDDIDKHINENQAVALILLDLSAAFDTIDHKLLIEKLQIDYGIDNIALKWITSYLKNRTFCVKINGKMSVNDILLFGVPQGSLLGPILFILYTKDLKKIADAYGLSIQLYADDSQLYIVFDVKNDNDKTAKLELIEQCLNKIKHWMVQHFMKLNENKTQFIVLAKNSIIPLCNKISLQIPGSIIEQSQSVNESLKSLGVKLDTNLDMIRQINDVKMKCFWTLSNIRRFGQYLDENLKITLVKTLILSKVDYCNALYAGVSQYGIRKLKSIIDNSVRFIYNINDWTIDLLPYYQKAHILPIRLRIQYKVCLLVHKALNGTAPLYLRELLHLYRDEPSKKSLRAFTDKTLLMKSHLMETKITRRMFSFHAPTMWNSLPVTLRNTENTEKFKKDLKTYLFQFI